MFIYIHTSHNVHNLFTIYLLTFEPLCGIIQVQRVRGRSPSLNTYLRGTSLCSPRSDTGLIAPKQVKFLAVLALAVCAVTWRITFAGASATVSRAATGSSCIARKKLSAREAFVKRSYAPIALDKRICALHIGRFFLAGAPRIAARRFVKYLTLFTFN